MKKIFVIVGTLFFSISALSQELEVGISYYKRGEYDKCVDKMVEVLKQREDITAYRYLALCLIKAKRCDEAGPFVERWKKIEMAEASYYAGVCRMEKGDYKGAISEFKDALNAPYPINEYARLFLGELFFKIGDEKSGRNYLKMAESGKNPDVRKRARVLLKEKGFFRYRVDLATGYNYDSNTGLLPDDPSLRALFTRYFERKFDNRWFGSFRGDISLRPFRRFYSIISYDFYQNLHQRLHNINFQIHRAGLEGRIEITEKLMASIYVGYSRAFISTDLNSFSEGGMGKIGLSYKVDSLEFGGDISISKTAYYEKLPKEQDRDGWFQRMELYSRKTFPKLNLYAGYLIENSNTYGRDWDYTSHTLTLKGFLNPIKNLSFLLSPFYTYREFRHKDSIFVKRRVDNEVGVEAVIGYEIFEYLNLFLSYGFYLENSNIEMYDYKRSIVGAGIGVRVE